MTVTLPERVAANVGRFTGREWLLPILLQWWDRGDERLFLLTGPPGTGKTMLLAWLAGFGPAPEGTAAKGQLAGMRGAVKAAHFCQASSRNLSPRAFAETVAHQLTETVTAFGDALAATLAERIQVVGTAQASTVGPGASLIGIKIGPIDLGTLGDESSFDRAFTLPLKKLYENGHPEPMLILVDALDEALGYTGEKTLPALLATLDDLPRQVRLLATTRDEPRVLKFFRSNKRFDLIEDAAPEADDVRVYAEGRLRELAVEGIERRDFAQRLAAHARGVFLYAALVLDDLSRCAPAALPNLNAHPLPDGLSGLYHDFLTRELGRDERMWSEQFRPLLGLVAVAQGEGFTASQLQAITKRGSDEVRDTLRKCKQYLSGDLPKGPFRPFHHSFTDFLLEDPNNADYRIDAHGMHERLAKHYLHQWSVADARGRGVTQPVTTTPDLPEYASRYLTTHLRLAGLHADLRVLAHDFAWKAAQLERDPSGGAHREDLTQLWEQTRRWNLEALPSNCPQIGEEIYCALAMAGLNDLAGQTPPTLLRVLAEHGHARWATEAALTLARQVVDPGNKVRALTELIPLLPSHRKDVVMTEASEIAEKISQEWTKAEVLLALYRHLPQSECTRRIALLLKQAIGCDSEWRKSETLRVLVPVLPENLIPLASNAAQQLEDDYNRGIVLDALGRRLADGELRQLIRNTPKSAGYRPVLIAERLRRLRSGQTTWLQRILLGSVARISDDRWQAALLAAMAPYLARPLLGQAVNIARRHNNSSHGRFDRALVALVPRLSDDLPARAFGLVELITASYLQTDALLAILESASAVAKRPVDMDAPLTVARAISHPYWRAEALARLVAHAPDLQRNQVLGDALTACREASAAELRGEIAGKCMVTLAGLAVHLHEAERRTVFKKIEQGRGEFEKRALILLAPNLPEDLLKPALQVALRLKSEKHEREVLVALIPRLTTKFAQEYLLRDRLASARRHKDILHAILNSQILEALWDDFLCQNTPVAVLAPLVPKLPQRLLVRALKIARSLQNPSDQAWALATLALRMRTKTRRAALFRRARQQRATRYANDDAMAAFALCYAESGLYDEAVREVSKISQHSPARARTLLDLIPRMPQQRLRELLALSESLSDWNDRLRVLTALPPDLSIDRLNELMDVVLKAVDPEPGDLMAHWLAPLLAHLPNDQRAAVWKRIFKLAPTVGDDNSRYRMLVALGPSFLRDAAHLPALPSYELLHRTLQLAVSHGLADILDYVRALGPLAFAFASEAAVQEIFHTVELFERQLDLGNLSALKVGNEQTEEGGQ
ncbi:MAG TPA: hypothetical protein VGD78_07270 [Chthoniobacterales bacterium]